jgi:mono/diheme cytochrome c family protein
MTVPINATSIASAALLLGFSFATANAALAAEPAVEAFLEKHCISCHGPEEEKGDLRIDQLSRDFKSGLDTHLWAEVIENVNSGAMPPKKKPRPGQEEMATFISTLDSLMKEGRAARMGARPPVAHYRLSRKEYQNTVYDLLGVRYDPTKPGQLNEDSLWHGYERIGSELTLSPSHVERYYQAAEIVLDRAFPTAAKETRKIRKTAAELRYRRERNGQVQQEWLDRLGIKRPLRYLMFPGMPHAGEEVTMALFADTQNLGWSLSPPTWFGASPPQSGLYRMRLQASGIRPPGGQLAHLRIGRKSSSGTIEGGLIEFDITAPEDAPQVYEFEVLLEMPANLYFEVVVTDVLPNKGGAHFGGVIGYNPHYIFTHSSENHLLDPTAAQMFDGQGNAIFPLVILDWIEWEGPLESETEKATRKGIIPPADATPEVVVAHLSRFAERAWRRPVQPQELEPFLTAYRSEREAGETVAEAYRVAMNGVLTSRHFIYLVEGATEPRPHLTDTELATRLSYFLWSSMPDDALFTAAKNGDLSGGNLNKHVDRLLTDGKVNRFIEDFSRQWLQLHRLGMFTPDKKLYPSYDGWLEESLRHEPVEFFREMFANNLPIHEFLDSDWTMANARVSDFYGLPEPKIDGFQRVALKPEDHRGGLLAMGAVLGLTSDGTRHRPVHRGVWLSEAIFNKTPPPPPANVDPIEPTPPDSPKATIRQKLEMHANDANCAACHSSIDPLGFAWDQYDAIGKWRTRELDESGRGENPPVNASGILPDGRKFADAKGFKQLLLEDRDKFRRAFIEHLSTYALRRVLTFDDQDDLKAIEEEAKKHNHGVKDIVRAIATSELVRKR